MIFSNDLIYIERQMSQIPWIKIFTQKNYKELSQCDNSSLEAILKATMCAEKTMIKFYKPDKINIASFGNYVPKLHIHVMARFKNDNFFPETMWGQKQREVALNLPNFDEFSEILCTNLIQALN